MRAIRIAFEERANATVIAKRFHYSESLVAITKWVITRVDASADEYFKISFSENDPNLRELTVEPEAGGTVVYFYFHVQKPLDEKQQFATNFICDVFSGIHLDNSEEENLDIHVTSKRKQGTHFLAVDFGTSASCVALKKSASTDDPSIQNTARHAGVVETIFPSKIWITSKKGKEGVYLKTPLVNQNTGDKYYVGMGIEAINEGMAVNPSGIVSSLKKIIDKKSLFWENFHLSEEDMKKAPELILNAYLRYLFNQVCKKNPIWGRLPSPLIEKIVVTVPNGASFKMMQRLKHNVQVAFNNARMAGEPMIPDWEMSPDNIEVISEAEASAAEYIYRLKNGMRDITVNEAEAVAVFDLGAGTSDAVLLTFIRASQTNAKGEIEIYPRMDIENKFGWDIGGDDLDTIFSRYILTSISKDPSVIKMDSATIKQLYENIAIYDEESDLGDFIEDLIYNIGFFDRYHSLKKRYIENVGENEGNQDGLNILQQMRSTVKDLATDIKISIATLYYDPSKKLEFTKHGFRLLSEPCNGQIILNTMYQILEDHGLSNEDKQNRINDQYTMALEAYKSLECEFIDNLSSIEVIQPVKLNLGSLYNSDNQLSTFLERVGGEFVDELLKNWQPKTDKGLHVVISGRLAFFPLVQETIILKLVSKLDVLGNITLANKGLKPDALKRTVVFGACNAIDSGQDLNYFNHRTFSNYVLRHNNQLSGVLDEIALVKKGSQFNKNSHDDIGSIEGCVEGIRLRPAARASDNLKIFEMEHDDFQSTKEFNKNSYRMKLIYDSTIEKDGDFDDDGDKKVQLTLLADGNSTVKVYPSIGGGQYGEPRVYVPEAIVDIDDDNTPDDVNNRFFPL